MSIPELLLTEEQRYEFTRISPNISKQELINFYTFSSFDLEHINKHRREYNKLGFAVQVSFLHNTGWNFLRIEDKVGVFSRKYQLKIFLEEIPKRTLR